MKINLFGKMVKIVLFALFAALVVPLNARAELPSVQFGDAELVDPTTADGVLGTGTTHSMSLKFSELTPETEVVINANPVELAELARALRYDPALIYEYVRNKIEIEPTFGLTKGALGAYFDEYGTAFDQAHLLVELLKIADANSPSAISASYKYGTISLNTTQFEAWFGITDAKAACQLLARGGFPGTVNSASGDCATINGTVSTITMRHVWVEVTVAGQIYQLDPSYKDHTFFTGINLATSMGYSASGISSAAGMGSGTDSGVSYVNNIDAGAVESTLDGYANTLLDYIRDNMADDTELEDVIGGREIIEEILPNGLDDAILPYALPSSTTWSEIPDQYRTTLRVEFYENSNDIPSGALLYVDEIYGRTLQLDPGTLVGWTTGTGTGVVHLQVDGQNIVGFIRTTGTLLSLSLYFVDTTVNHPYAADAGAYMDRFAEQRADVFSQIIIAHGWGHVSQTLMSRYGEELPRDEVFPDALSGNPECPGICSDTPGGSANNNTNQKIGANWLAQMSRMGELQAEIGDAVFQHHHSIVLVSNQMEVFPQFYTGNWFVGDQVTRIDVDSGISIVHESADQDSENAVAQAISAAANALEGSIFEQMIDTPDTASTAERFEWGEVNISSGLRFYLFQPADAADVRDLLAVDVGNDCPGFCPGDPSYDEDAVLDSGEQSIVAYLNSGYSVIAANDAFLGPGWHMGYKESLYDEQDGSVIGTNRHPSMQRGAAFIAFKEDANGNIIDVAHIVTGLSDDYKGGGASLDPNHEEEYNPAEAADILKDRFEDRSSALGVDLGSGIPGWSSGTLISVGSGGFPYELSASVKYKRGVRHQEGTNPNFFGMAHNWEIEASISGSGMAAMGEDNVKNAVASIVNFYAAQDVARQGSNVLDKIVLMPFINHWWLQYLTYNSISVEGGGDGQQFFRLVDGTYNAPGGSTAKLVKLGGERFAYRRGDGYAGADNFDSVASITRNWDYSLITGFTLTLGDGSVQTFSAFIRNNRQSTQIKTSFLLTRWEMPSGFGVTLTYQDYKVSTGGLNGKVTTDVVFEVTNDFGRTLTFSTPKADLLDKNADYIQIDDLANGQSVRIDLDGVTLGSATGFIITHLDGTQTKVSPGCISLSEADVCSGGDRPFYGALPIETVFSPLDLVNPSLRYTYDALHRVTLAEDAQTILDAATGASNPRPGYQFFIVPGHRGERLDPLGGEFTVYYDQDSNPAEFIDELGRSVTASYDGLGRITRRVYPEGDESLFTYDANSNVTSFTQVAKPGSGLANRVVSATWDLTYNKPLSVTDFLGATSTFVVGTTAGAKGQITSATLPKPAALSSAPVWSFGFTADGQVQSVTGPLGAKTLNVYDALGNLSSIAVDSLGLNYITNFEYDAIGNRTAMIDARGTAGGTTFKTSAEYDAMRRVIRTTGPEGEVTTHTYDAAGEEVVVEQTLGNSYLRTVTTYTATGQEQFITSPDGATTANFYDFLDRKLEVHDAEGRITRIVYDAVGQTLKEIRAYGTNLQQDYSTFTYSENGQPLSITDANGNKSESFYDGFDQLIKLQYPDKLTVGVSSASDFEAFTYDANGNVITKTTRKGDIITNGYDVLNRIVSKAPGADRVVEYFYDARGRQTEIKYADGSQYVQHTYDALGRITSTDTKLPGGISTNKTDLVYTYDKIGNRTSITHPDNEIFNYAYDFSSRLTTVKEDNNLLATYTYDDIGRRTSLVQDSDPSSADHTVSYFYESDSALDLLSHDLRNSANDVSYGFDYNLANQVTVRTVDNGAYQYDGLADKVESYTANGLNQYTDILKDGVLVGLTYDDAGNLLSDGTWTYTYDVENRLTSADDGTTHVDYDYDPLGRRVMKDVDGVETYYLSDGTEEVLELDDRGNIDNRYVFGAGVDEPILMYTGDRVSNNKKRYYRADPQGSIIAITDNSGDIEELFTYSAYGEPDNPAGNAIRYTGRRWDPETGLYYYRARYYNPSLGRFLQTDPVGYGDNTNLYAYVNNDPMNNNDPEGKFLNFIVGAIIGAVVDAAVEVASQIIAGEDIDIGAVAQAAAEGAVIGALTGGAGNIVKAVKGVAKLAKAASKGTKAKTAAQNAGKKAGSSGGPGAGKPIAEGTKNAAEKQAGGKCVFCGKKTTRQKGPNQRNTDHADPKSKGGNNSLENSQNTCRTCNQQKGTRTTQEFDKAVGEGEPLKALEKDPI